MATIGVFAALFDEQGRILCVRQADAAQRWSTPGGGVEKGEAPMEALFREVAEESGYLVRARRLIGAYAAPFKNDLALSFEVEIVGQIGWKPTREITEIGWFARNALPSPMRAWTYARIQDAFDGKSGILRVFRSKSDRAGDILPALLDDDFLDHAAPIRWPERA